LPLAELSLVEGDLTSLLFASMLDLLVVAEDLSKPRGLGDLASFEKPDFEPFFEASELPPLIFDLFPMLDLPRNLLPNFEVNENGRAFLFRRRPSRLFGCF